MSFPNDLLEQARHLANLEPNRPKQASLRRAVSTAYYALFHLLSFETALNWRRPAERGKLARMLEHGNMSRSCQKTLEKLRADLATTLPQHDQTVCRHLQRVTEAFIDMYQQRQTADYDIDTTWTRTEVINKIQSVETAFRSWRLIRDEDRAQTFLTALLLKERK